MLKGFVSGEEKDIVRIPMKGKNLWSEDYTGISGDLKYVPVFVGDGTFTLSTDTPSYSGNAPLFLLSGNVTSGASTPTNGVYNGVSRTTNSSNGYITIAFRRQSESISPITHKTMLNLGSTPLPYEPYGYQEGWEVRDNQDRILWGREDELQTATGTLPFKGYSLPVKVKSLLGNAVQNGTPAPDNIIIPEMCGVRTGNLFDINRTQSNTFTLDTSKWFVGAATTSAASPNASCTVSDGKISVESFTPGHGACFMIPVTGQTDYVFTFDVDKVSSASYVGYSYRDANGDILYTSTISEKSVILTTYPNTAFIDFCFRCTPADGKVEYSNIMLNLGSTALPYEPYGWKVPFENHGENLCPMIFSHTGVIDDNGGTGSYNTRLWSDKIPVSASQSYYVVIDGTASNDEELCFNRIIEYDANGVFISRINVVNLKSTSFTTSANCRYVTLDIRTRTLTVDISVSDINTLMLTPGSEPKPYSQYLNETLPVYLGEVPTVRRVKKLVLDGTESWTINGNGSSRFFYFKLSDTSIVGTDVISTHFPSANVGQTTSEIGIGLGGPAQLRVRTDDPALYAIESWKSWLSSNQPTIWYVLNEPETTISNEPLCKISTYADELTTIQVHGLSAPLYGIRDYKDVLNLSTGVVTRKVKKLVLTGNEAVDRYVHANTVGFAVKNLLDADYNRAPGICSHYMVDTLGWISRLWIGVQNKILYFVGIGDVLGIDTATEFKAWLTAQYQAGTPVTVWYVLNTSETETVTVPTGMTGEIEGYLTQVSIPTPTNCSVPKWNGVEETGGTYAVTVYTPPEIPTTTGGNTLTVETEKIHGLTNPLCGIGDYKDVLNLSTGVVTRKVKKLVFDGTEAFTKSSWGKENTEVYYTPVSGSYNASYSAIYVLSSHFQGVSRNTLYNSDGVMIGMSGTVSITFRVDKNYATTADFKAFLAAQYANGTPVTVWYVLETPETETITVPYGLECSVEGYLTQSGTPIPSSPITPDSNGILESDGTYAVEVSLVPSNLTVKGHIKELT